MDLHIFVTYLNYATSMWTIITNNYIYSTLLSPYFKLE